MVKHGVERPDLLNFHFSSQPEPQQQQQQQPQNRRNKNNQNNHRRGSKKNHHDPNEVRRKRPPTMFNLHASIDHAFVISRRGLKSQPYSFTGCDDPVSWEVVRMVKHHVSAQQHEEIHCPICLDTFLGARITKCGHCFCLGCLLRHVQVHAASNPYTNVKCPCCALPLHMADIRPVLIEYQMRPKLQQRVKLVKLHRTKDCPTPYLPLPDACKRSTRHAAPCVSDRDANYCRFNYVDPVAYLSHLTCNQEELREQFSSVSALLARTRPATTATRTTVAQSRQVSAAQVEQAILATAMDIVAKEIGRAMEEQAEELALMEKYDQACSGVQQPQPLYLMADQYSIVAATVATTTTTTTTEEHSPYDGPNAKLDDSWTHHSAGGGRMHGESIGSEQDLAAASSFTAAGESVVSSESTRKVHGESIGSEERSYHYDDDVVDVSTRPRLDSFVEETVHVDQCPKSPENRYRGNSIGSETDRSSVLGRHRGFSVGSEADTSISKSNNNNNNNNNGHRKKSSLQHKKVAGSMYLDEESTHFYQSADGQICFLNGFNMNCLLSDYSAKLPQDAYQSAHIQALSNETPSHGNKPEIVGLPPLPDTIEGEVVEIETVLLTPNLRKRMPFLSHLPLYMEITFLELDCVYRMLSPPSKQKFRSEFEKRRKRRTNKAKAEKREGRLAKKKEQDRINELKARMQRIDPSDEFFQVALPPVPQEAFTGEDFGPSISSSSRTNAAMGGGLDVAISQIAAAELSFSNVCRSGGVFPGFHGGTVSSNDDFPSLGSNFPALSSSPTTKPRSAGSAIAAAPSWGKRPTQSTSIDKTSSTPARVTPSHPPPPSAGKGRGKKKGKGEKIVLFSTGGQRGTY